MKIVDIIGNPNLLERHKTLFLCSKHAPYGCYETVFEWVESLTEEDCVMCFNTSELEVEVLQALLVAHVPTVLFSMVPVSHHTFNLQIEEGWNEHRFAVVVLERDEPRGAGYTPKLRNSYAISLADNIVCGYIDPKGSISPLLRGLKKEITYLIDNKTPIAAEPIPKHARWTVGEDKHLLRLHYADMGIHTMHRELGRPYFSIRQRVHALALDDYALMGREFEDYVLELLFDGREPWGAQTKKKSNSQLTLREWRGDKTLGDVFPQGNRLPDLVLEVDKQIIAVECKWRKRLTALTVEELFTPDRLECFQQYSKDTLRPVYLLLGTGGIPSEPEHLYFVPVARQFKLFELKKSNVPADELKSKLILTVIQSTIQQSSTVPSGSH